MQLQRKNPPSVGFFLPVSPMVCLSVPNTSLAALRAAPCPRARPRCVTSAAYGRLENINSPFGERQKSGEEQHKGGARAINWKRWRRSRTPEKIPNGIWPLKRNTGPLARLPGGNHLLQVGLVRHGCGELGGRQGKASLPGAQGPGGAFPYDDGCGAAYRSIGMP